MERLFMALAVLAAATPALAHQAVLQHVHVNATTVYDPGAVAEAMALVILAALVVLDVVRRRRSR